MNYKKKYMVISISLNILLIAGIILYQSGGLSYLKHIFIKDTIVNTSPYYLEKKSQFDDYKIPQNSIVFLGDSLTDRCEWRELFNNNSIYNRGIDGDTTLGVINRLDNIVKYKPSKVFIMIGTNDINSNIAIDTIYKNYKNIVQQINEKSPNTKVYIQSLLPINDKLLKSNRKNADIMALNSKLSTIGNSTFINLYSLLLDGTNLNKKYTIDGLHLNIDGYLIWKQAIEKYVNE